MGGRVPPEVVAIPDHARWISRVIESMMETVRDAVRRESKRKVEARRRAYNTDQFLRRAGYEGAVDKMEGAEKLRKNSRGWMGWGDVR